MTPTIYEVARLSGVSTATVSRVMAGGRGFSTATRKRVLDAAAELGWVPNGTARSLAARRTGIVGLLFPDLGKAADAESESPLFVDQVIRGAEHAATVANHAVLLAGTRGSAARELVRSVIGKVDGVVVVARAVSGRQLREVADQVPVVAVSANESRRRLDFVTVDNRSALRDLVAHLTLVHGYRDLAFVAGPTASPDSHERFLGFADGLADAGLPAPETPEVSGGFTERGGERAVAHLLERRGRPPRVIVAGNDEMALGAMSALRARGLRVPEDVAVTGFDDITSARHVRPTLTTVHQPMRDIGQQAVQALLARIADPDLPRHTVVVPTTQVVRRSCGCTRPSLDRRTPA